MVPSKGSLSKLRREEKVSNEREMNFIAIRMCGYRLSLFSHSLAEVAVSRQLSERVG